MSKIIRTPHPFTMMPAWHRPWLRYVTSPDEGGAMGEQSGNTAEPDASASPAGEQSGNAQEQQNETSSRQNGSRSIENATPEELVAEVKRLRAENAASRTNAKTEAANQARNDLVQQFAKV